MPRDRAAAGESASWITRTAMCAEPRNGVLYVFMPPMTRLEDYLELVAAVEATAAGAAPAVISRATSRRATRGSNKFSVTPDPGVIEVNIHPASSWDELVDHTTHLYEAARLAPRHREVHARRPPHRHRRRQPRRARRRDARTTRRSCAGPICCAACSPTGTTTRRSRTCSRASSSARPRRRRASTRRATTRSTRSRSPSDEFARRRLRRRCPPWLVDRLLPQSARRRHRQHPPRRVLHRQAVLARRHRGTPRPPRAARLRDAAARADEPHAAAAAARAGRALLEGTVRAGAPRALGHRAPRPLHAAVLRLAGLRGRARGDRTPPATRSRRSGSRRTSSSASRSAATSPRAASRSSSARRSSPGT